MLTSFHMLQSLLTIILHIVLQYSITTGVTLANERGVEQSPSLYVYDRTYRTYTIPNYRRAPSGFLYWKLPDVVRGKQVS